MIGPLGGRHMHRIAGVLFVFVIFTLAPAAAQSPQYRRPTPAQEECPQGRQIRAQKSYPASMTDCEVLDADTAAENQKLRRGPGANPAAQQPVAPAVVKKEDPRQHEIDEDLKLGYETISFEDFALDTKDLTKTSKKIAVVGYYRKIGNIDEFFPSNVAAMQSDAMPSSLRIFLLSDDAPRALRAYFLRCSSSPGVSSMGCWARIRGHASTCEHTVFGYSQERACFIVDGGWVLNQ
jgi:hypothetical protein